ncbi:helix-turn-helix domain-containing protein [Streptosporangium sp. CA-135522]|uniref:helix-turn-helix domain-containing protein n=1 Tax=Streptosporangium sp. CA-135522 TaxID=3240072 RepID=UPI003D93EFA3
MDLGDRLREVRVARNLTQAEVARRAGISQPALSCIELGGGVPTLEMLDRIGRAMGVRFTISVGDDQAEQVDLLAGWLAERGKQVVLTIPTRWRRSSGVGQPRRSFR